MSDEKSEAPGEVDLFGMPVRPIRDRRGRPCFKKDKENQDFVAVRIAAGWSQARIAEDMGIDEKTLRKHFSRELENGRVFVEGLVLDVLLKQTREGKSPAIRQLREMLEAAGPQAPRGRSKPKSDEEEEDEDGKAAPVGKKEQQMQDAQVVPPEYGDIFDRIDRRH
ncbi:conserved hypothetical protein [Ancylobacter novellus DSM 506]|uniref:Uncharacterized protein n=2 Tax=Ancylobacter novellus TaxID=921 RepID=D6ZZT4_ANCN5|nr:conserved hypothetical protein [Ancylobacter novellus DSM 506]